MNYTTARDLLVSQVSSQVVNQISNSLGHQGDLTQYDEETLLGRLQQGKLPVPGQVTTLLLALKVLFEALHETEQLERELVYALYRLACDSRQLFEAGLKQGVNWSPLLDEDLTRIEKAVSSIFAGVWAG